MTNSSNTNVLIIDENSDFHNVVRKAIDDLGLNKVSACASAEAALRAIDQGPAPDLIIMELNLGGAKGLNLMAQIRAGKTAAEINIPIIVMTRNLVPETAARACDIGFEHFVRKPFIKEALQKRVTSVLQNPRRFVVARTYFGPDRRESENKITYDGPERRGANTTTSDSSGKIPAPEPAAPKHTISGSTVLDDAPQNAATNGALSPAKNNGARTAAEQSQAIAASAEAKEQLKSAPKLPPAKPLASQQKTPVPPEQEDIELAGTAEKPTSEADPDRAAEIAAKLAAILPGCCRTLHKVRKQILPMKICPAQIWPKPISPT
tara:strand:+ start:14781 stop:15743 length:963 start_codon:yes stop_codon:yes gene_type:complete